MVKSVCFVVGDGGFRHLEDTEQVANEQGFEMKQIMRS